MNWLQSSPSCLHRGTPAARAAWSSHGAQHERMWPTVSKAKPPTPNPLCPIAKKPPPPCLQTTPSIVPSLTDDCVTTLVNEVISKPAKWDKPSDTQPALQELCLVRPSVASQEGGERLWGAKTREPAPQPGPLSARQAAG